MVAKIKEISGDSIHAVFDAFGDATSQQISLDVLAPGKGTVITTFFTDEAVAAKVRSDVTIISELIRSSISLLIDQVFDSDLALHCVRNSFQLVWKSATCGA